MVKQVEKAAKYDKKTRGAELGYLGQMRDRLIGGLCGDVLELGAGTGANFAHYDQCARVTAIEPDGHMLEGASAKLASLTGANIALQECHAERLPFTDRSFDAVVATLVLCSVGDLEATLREVMRVLRPNGEFRFIEHVRGTWLRGAIQDLVSPVWSRVGTGCTPNRRTPRALQLAGFRVELIEERASLGVTAPIVSGIARRSTLPEPTFDLPSG